MAADSLVRVTLFCVWHGETFERWLPGTQLASQVRCPRCGRLALVEEVRAVGEEGAA